MNAVAEKLGELGLPRPVSELAAQDWDVVIVGGGHNGLTAAAYLAREGKSVLVLERRERVGGACTLERPFSDERYVVSPCAYVVGVLDELVISELGLRERGVQISVADPALFIPFDDGTAFVEFDDEEKTARGASRPRHLGEGHPGLARRTARRSTAPAASSARASGTLGSATPLRAQSSRRCWANTS